MSASRLSNRQIAALIVVAAVGGYVLGRLSTNLRLNLGPGAPSMGDSTDFVLDDPGPLAEDSELAPVGDAPFLGPGSATVTILEFSDFQCPYCQRVNPILHQVLDTYDGEIRLVFRNLPLPMHPDARPAARAALAAHEQGAFWAYHDLLFANSRALDRASLEAYAEELDLDMDAFRGTMDAEATAERVEADLALARRLGLNGTPSFLVNGRPIIGAVPLDEFRRIIDAEMEAAQELLDSGVALGQVYRRRVAANRPESASPEEDPRREAPAPAVQSQEPSGRAPVSPPPADGRATLTAYVDYTDPDGRRLGRTLDRLITDYGERLDLTLEGVAETGDEIGLMTVAALREAQRQGLRNEFHHFMVSGDDPYTREHLERWAEQSGLDTEEFAAALDSAGRAGDDSNGREAASRAGVIVLPTVMVGELRLVGPVPYEDLRVAIDSAVVMQ